LIRLPKLHNGDDGLAISVFEAPGPNYLRELIKLGPNAFSSVEQEPSWNMHALFPRSDQIPLLLFLDFAIGATKCCEILHSQNRIVHGEIRGDAFHFNQKTRVVKMLNFGSGARSFESGLSAAGWYSLSREYGVEHKLRFIAPEQTGRLPAEPDGRTDIYSLGVLFWTVLTVCFLTYLTAFPFSRTERIEC
jgi:serine/threonine protein kinase